MNADDSVVLDVRDLRVYFFTRSGIGKAVDGVTFNLLRGKTLGLVGESGCGKSVTALSIIGLHPRPAARIVGGHVLFRGEDLLKKTPLEMRRYRGKHIAMILQDPFTALNPVFTVGDQVCEPLRLHQHLRGSALRECALQLLRLLRIPDPEQRFNGYPHQFSGGMRQRVVGAIGISCQPDVLIADEPTTALDVTIQAAYLALLKEIQSKTNLAMLFITHDFAVVSKMCDRVAVMYAGRIVENASTEALFDRPAHPYTQGLLNSVPDVRTETKRLPAIPGAPPSIYRLPKGCPFAERCEHAMSTCLERFPPKTEVGRDHTTACWKYA